MRDNGWDKRVLVEMGRGDIREVKLTRRER